MFSVATEKTTEWRRDSDLTTSNHVDGSKSDDNEMIFKLADPGFARSITKKSERLTDVPKGKMLRGTTAYGKQLQPI